MARQKKTTIIKKSGSFLMISDFFWIFFIIFGQESNLQNEKFLILQFLSSNFKLIMDSLATNLA